MPYKKFKENIENVHGHVISGGGDQYDMNFPQLLRNRLYNKVTWNEVERAWLRMKKEAVDSGNFSLQKVLEYRLKESLTGCFLYHLNKNEATTPELQQKKLDIAQFLLRINEFPTVYKRNNDYTENIMSLLINTVAQSKTGIVTEQSVLKNMPSLRLARSKIGCMDYTLKECSGLEALILTANYITDFDGVVLPHNLKLLELYGNLLYDIDLLAKNAPKQLLFIGLGRNYLSRAASIKLFSRYLYLCYLDLSDNDFENLDELVYNLKALKRLKSLLLIGNPCTVVSNYKSVVVASLPTLELLDGVELNGKNVDPAFLQTTQQETIKEAVLNVYGFRFFNIPKPKRKSPTKRQKIEGYYQLEIEFPLLDDKLAEYEANVLTHELNNVPLPIVPEIDEMTKTIERPVKRSPPRVFKPSSLKKDKTLDTNKLKIQELEYLDGLSEKYYDFLEGDEEIFKAKKFFSNKTQWAPVIKFPNPALTISVPLENIRMLRDTFRTVMNIRLYYKEETGIGRSKAQTEAGRKRMSLRKTSKRSKRISIKIIKKHPVTIPKTATGQGDHNEINQPVKTITRNLICKIPVPLQMTNWSQDYMGYTWDIREHCLAKPYPGLKNLNIGSRRTRTKRELFMSTPKMLTCHVGVGIKRPGTTERMGLSQKSGKRSQAGGNSLAGRKTLHVRRRSSNSRTSVKRRGSKGSRGSIKSRNK